MAGTGVETITSSHEQARQVSSSIHPTKNHYSTTKVSSHSSAEPQWTDSTQDAQPASISHMSINLHQTTTSSFLRPFIMLNIVVSQFLNRLSSSVLLSLRTSYIVPALFLNPGLMLHFFNTFASHQLKGPFPPSDSPYQWFENLGPVANAPVLFDVHKNDGLLWIYTVVSVALQLWAFGKVSHSREVAKQTGELKTGGRLGSD